MNPASPFAIRGRLLFGTQLEPGTIVIEAGRIERVVRGHEHDGNLPGRVIDGGIVSPGMIDLQVNGGGGVPVDENPENIDHIARWSLTTGVTGWLPTVVTAGASHYPRVFDGYRRIDPTAGATPLGLHLEGPFLAPARKGAHQLRYIEAADDALFESWLEERAIRLVTLAPERPGAAERIRSLVERGIVVSLGHTDATFDEFRAGIDVGATKATHLFNAMSAIHHRQPGAMVATLLDQRVTAGLIPDAVHSHPAMVRLAIQSKGPDRIAIVSDMIAAAGLGPGAYELGGQAVRVEGSTVSLPDGTLAGSVLTMDQAVRNLVAWGDVTPGTALHMCTRTPADVIGESTRGRLVRGCRADITIWDDDLQVTQTIVDGSIAWERDA